MKIWCPFFLHVMWSKALGITTTYHHSQTFTICFSRKGRFAVKRSIGPKWPIQSEKCLTTEASVPGVELARSTRTSKDVVMVVPYQIHATLSSGNVARPRMIDFVAAATRPILQKFPRSQQRLLLARQRVLDHARTPWMAWRGQRLPASVLPKWRDDPLMEIA